MNCANHLDRERVSFCQNCGKPLCLECSRAVGSSVFCEPCLAARLAGAPNVAQVPFNPMADPGPSMPTGLPPVPGVPNPVVAALLGFIPGVGAMYNGQYAKAVVHIVVFALLVSLADANGVFGLFVAGWVFYMAFEAYHTANARRFGTPLPNPFGLNDIGERFGFGRAWGAAVPPASVAPGAVPPTTVYQDAAGTQGFASGGPQFTQAADDPLSYVASGAGTPGWSNVNTGYAATPPTPQYGNPYPAVDPYIVTPPNRFPVGAIVLIVLGLIFFFGSTGFLFHLPIQRLLPLFLIVLGVWLFIRKLTASRLGLLDDGAGGYPLRFFQALRASVWVVLVGVLFLLNDSGVLSWGRSWPLFIILAGVMTLLQRFAEGAAVAGSYGYGGIPPVSPIAPVPESAAPLASNDPEGGR